MSKLTNALQRLTALTETGVEYPEAHSKVCTELELSERQAVLLTEAYDGATGDKWIANRRVMEDVERECAERESDEWAGLAD